nr:hypothetical protein [Tanacetum cinerariifolium]
MAKLEEERYEYMIRYSALFDNDKQHRKQIADQEVLFDKMSVELVELDKHVRDLENTVFEKDFKISELEECVCNKDLEIEKCLERLNVCENKLHKMGQTNQTIHMIMPFKDNLYNGQKGIGFENLSYFEKAKDLRPTLYDEKVIGLGYTPMLHSDEALEIEKFKRSRENKIEFAYDYKESECKLYLETFSSVRRPKNSGVIWKKKGSSNTSNVDLFVVSHSKLNKNVKRYSRKDLLSCNNSHLRETRSAYMCYHAMNVSCNSMMCDLFDDNNFFIFDDESVRISPVSKMRFRKKPCDSMNVCSKSNSIKSLSRTMHKWIPKLQPLAEPVAKWIPRICLWIIDLGCSKHMMGNRALLTNFVKKFLGTVRFGNNDFAVIAGYGDVVIGSMTIKKFYYIVQIFLWIINSGCSKHMTGNRALLTNFVEKFLGTVRFGNNDFEVIVGYGDEVIDGVDLLTGDHSSNFYTIALNEVASNSSTCLLAKASSSQSWLWHQRLSHLNFATINNLVKNNLVQGLPKMKFEKDHLCSAYEQGEIHRKHHKSKTTFASNKPLYLLHMDLCGPIRVQSINGKRYVLIVIDDYSQYTWVFFLHSKDEASEVIISFIKKTQVNLQLQVQRVRTDNGTELKNLLLSSLMRLALLKNFLLQERHNKMAEAIATACFTQNLSIIHKRFDKTPYELINKRKPNIKFFRVFGCRCYLLNDYVDVGKLKEKGDIRVFVGYSKESTTFRIYNKRTRKIHESVNVNFDEISEMASKQFSLESGLSNLNEMGKSPNRSVSKVDETSKKYLEDLFQDFYDEYFDSSKIMKSPTTNV